MNWNRRTRGTSPHHANFQGQPSASADELVVLSASVVDLTTVVSAAVTAVTVESVVEYELKSVAESVLLTSSVVTLMSVCIMTLDINPCCCSETRRRRVRSF